MTLRSTGVDVVAERRQKAGDDQLGGVTIHPITLPVEQQRGFSRQSAPESPLADYVPFGETAGDRADQPATGVGRFAHCRDI
ncbi:hypothetical protein [Candidatus Neomicrothrix sp.]|uniref:hypothetical protein n=1 Tax=Candidatus Neomicrothrix sp. TaxID=2719034 RepID=UPI0025917FC7|nr:hypothetical protein [Candidatus Microthrix sp.]HMS46999.1 hypothetical protein [Candidatus Microthrix sp.]